MFHVEHFRFFVILQNSYKLMYCVQLPYHVQVTAEILCPLLGPLSQPFGPGRAIQRWGDGRVPPPSEVGPGRPTLHAFRSPAEIKSA